MRNNVRSGGIEFGNGAGEINSYTDEYQLPNVQHISGPASWRLFTSPGGNGALELVGLLGQFAGDFWWVILSLLGRKALCYGEGIHVQRSTQESLHNHPTPRAQSAGGDDDRAESWNWTRGAARPIVVPCCIEMGLDQKTGMRTVD
jgi:hypothetical protein